MNLIERLRLVPRRYWIATGVYLVLAALFEHDWDGFVFRTVVEQLWAGATPYAVALERPYYAFLGVLDQDVQWYAYPPLPLLLMALTYAPAVFLSLPPFVGRVLIKLPMIVGTLLLARVAGGWAERLSSGDDALRGRRARVETWFLLNPFFVLVGVVWGMTDTLLMALMLAAVLAWERQRWQLAGLLFSASVLVKPFPALLLVPLLAYYAGRVPRRAWKSAATSGGILAGVVCLPFVWNAPYGFWTQVVGAHVGRPPQGVTLWNQWPLDLLPDGAVAVVSLLLVALTIYMVGCIGRRVDGPAAPLALLLATAAGFLLVNRVVNEQYLVMVVAPLALLALARDPTAGSSAFDLRGARWITGLYAANVVLVGFHFLTFIPPDIALPLFGRPVDFVAHSVRTVAPGFWHVLFQAFHIVVPLSLVWLLVRFRRWYRAQDETGTPPPRAALAAARRATRAHPTTVLSALGLAAIALLPTVMPGFAVGGDEAEPGFVPVVAEPKVSTFYYLWWNNAAHDPDIEYGNWFKVSQTPTMGYYTNTRGTHRAHAEDMVAHGIDAAIISYHRGELDRYISFQEEAQRAGLWVAPLVELNQVYDTLGHRPIGPEGEEVPYAAYRLDQSTRQAIEAFVFDLEERLQQPNQWRVDGKPVVIFYDSYVSGVGYHEQDKQNLADMLRSLYPMEHLREAFNDTRLQNATDDLLRHYPPTYEQFFFGLNETHREASHLWREAHFALHRSFWTTLRAELEQRLGPLHLISGDAFNDNAGFEASVAKSVLGLELFDGSFIYSPSFAWGNDPLAPFDDNMERWEDRNHWLQAFARGHDKLSMIGIAPAYDDTVNRPHGFKIPAKVNDEWFYDMSWDSMIARPPSHVAIATYNEWFEGSSIEASIEYGDELMKNTLEHRERFENVRPPSQEAAIVVHEMESRVNPNYSEKDDAHFWALELLGAAARGFPDTGLSAVDGRQQTIGAGLDAADFVIVEAGRPDYKVSKTVQDQIVQWRDTGVSMVLFGEHPAAALGLPLDRCAQRPLSITVPVTLKAGDRLSAVDGGLYLERDQTEGLVGVRCGDGFGWSSLRSWGGDPWVEATCMQVALRALLPEPSPSWAKTCHVPDEPGASVSE